MGGAGDIGGLLAIEDLRTAWKGTFHPAYDGNGNLMALTEASTGNMVAAYEYDPFGNPLRTSGIYANENSIRFSGKYYDTETGLTYHGFRYYNASLGRFVNRDPLEERGGWNLYSGLNKIAADPYAGASGVEGTSWSTEWEQAQDRLLANTSMPHTTQTVTFSGKRNSGLPGSSQGNQKTYSANATGHYAQGGAEGEGPQAPGMSVGNPAAGNADINLYIYTGNNPINSYDALGLYYSDSYFKDDPVRNNRFIPPPPEPPKPPIVDNDYFGRSDLLSKYRDLIKNIVNIKPDFYNNNIWAKNSGATNRGAEVTPSTTLNRRGFATPDAAGTAASREARSLTKQGRNKFEWGGEVYSYIETDANTGETTTLYGYTVPRKGKGEFERLNPKTGKLVTGNAGPTLRKSVTDAGVTGATVVAGYHSHTNSNSFTEDYSAIGGGDDAVVIDIGTLYLGRAHGNPFSSKTVVEVMGRDLSVRLIGSFK